MPLALQKLVLPAFCFALAFYFNDVYDRRRGSVSDPDATIGRAFLLAALIVFSLYGAVPSLRPSVEQLLTLFVLLLGVSYLYFPLRRHVRSLLSSAGMSAGQRVLVLGTSAVALAAARELEKSGCTVLHFVGRGPGQLLCTLPQAPAVIAEMKPGRIIVALRSPVEELPLREILEQRFGGVPVETAHEAYEQLTGKIFFDERTPLHLLASHACLSSRLYCRLKRVVSAAVAAMALVITLPVMALVALLIRATEKGPVLFVQERVGLHGRPFRLWKFRSMRVEKATSSEWERDNEERITPLGRWLRKLHLDELPQLWNILRGDMDLVGPRPHPVSNHELFARSIPYYSLRSLVRPGLTGWAQVRQGYANDLPSEIEKMRYDLCAIARPSLLRDLWVLLATAKIVLVGHSSLEREAFPAAEKADRDDSVALPFGARTPRASLDPESARTYPTASLRELDTREGKRNSRDRAGVPRGGDLKELRVSHSPPRRALEANELPQLAAGSARGGSFQPGNEGKAMANEVEGKVVALPSAAVESNAAREPEVVMHTMWDRIERLEGSRRQAPRFAATLPVAYPAMASVRPQGFARLLAAVAILSIAAATLRLIAQTWINTRPNPTLPATAMAIRPPEPTSPTAAATAMAAGPREPTSPATAAATGASDLASLDAAAARAKAAVQQYEVSNARVLKSVLAKSIGGGRFVGRFVDGIKQPRYQAEVHVEIPRSFGKRIQRKYSVTLQYVGSGEWQIERAVFATRY